MKRLLLAGILVLLVLWPLSARAEQRPPNALEVGATVATCMTQARRYAPGDGVHLSGTMYEATLIEYARPFMVLRRVDTYPPDDDFLANQPVQPPMQVEVIEPIDENRRETLRYAFSCLNPVIFPQQP